MFVFSLEIEMLVDDPKTCEDLHDLDLNHELCIHITEDMLSAQNNGCSGMHIRHVMLKVWAQKDKYQKMYPFPQKY